MKHRCTCDPYMGLCRAPKCPRDAVSDGLCDSHRKQRERNPDAPLRPLRAYREGKAREVVSLRVAPECREMVLADPEGARAALERWARAKHRAASTGVAIRRAS